MQHLLQRMLEEEVDGVLGRGRYERRAPIDAVAGYRNGFWQAAAPEPEQQEMTLRRPRVRGLSERFESRLLSAFKRRTEEVGRLLPECTSTDWTRATSISRCAGCSATWRRCRCRRSRG